ncbi:pyridoxamine 5'-phosphate oxidase family protein [Rhizobium leguminosarum]|uniref:pyridoxamine 5'-phosphate oxidase family protein n=1 Tax=Rhizobium leguminosarum TaxID=384 RepID=UPI0003A9F446|nr:pyridoxamine 5'-phosphate oxidase family protein [Rhizobium leguminosarum]
MDNAQAKKVILEFLRRHTLAVIATSHADGKPEAAVIDFSVRDNLEIVFDTFEQTRKFENLSDRRSVALVVGWDKNITVQYEGDAMKVSASDVQEYRRRILKAFRSRESLSRRAPCCLRSFLAGYDIPISPKTLSNV